VDVYSVLSPMMTTQKKILPAGGAFNRQAVRLLM